MRRDPSPGQKRKGWGHHLIRNLAERAFIYLRSAMESTRSPSLLPYPIEPPIDVESLHVLLGPPSMRIDVVAPSTSIDYADRRWRDKFERLRLQRLIRYAFTNVIYDQRWIGIRREGRAGEVDRVEWRGRVEGNIGTSFGVTSPDLRREGAYENSRSAHTVAPVKEMLI